jgi:hypothetical protein
MHRDGDERRLLGGGAGEDEEMTGFRTEGWLNIAAEARQGAIAMATLAELKGDTP